MGATRHSIRRRARLRAEAIQSLQQAKAAVARDRSRLIDFFKRLYTIIAGLAITDACRKLMPFDPSTFSWASFWMFAVFLVTIVPIFQGGDRSLDLKYLDERQDGRPHDRRAVAWDVFMLIITALIFAAVAESIPAVDKPDPNAKPVTFFFLMAGLFVFDVAVLIVDYAKSHVTSKLSSYAPWILLNFLLSAICLVAGLSLREHSNGTISTYAAAVFVCAFGRSFFDYALSGDFMFP